MFAVLIVSTVVLVAIVLHELGHLLSARYLGMSVSQFGIGFGPKLFGFRCSRNGRKGEIEWSVHAMPFGGFVRIHGMLHGMQEHERASLISEGRTEEECSQLLDSGRLYCYRTSWQQAFVISAGVIVNILFSIATLIFLLWFEGSPSTPHVDRVENVGSVTLSMGDTREDAQTAQRLSLWGATVEACSIVKESSVDVFSGLKEPIKNLGSLVWVVQEIHKDLRGNLHPGFIWVSIFIQINFCLAIFNILPIPGLDGGHLAFSIFKGVVGLPCPFAIQVISSAICIVMLSGLMVFLLIRDTLALLR